MRASAFKDLNARDVCYRVIVRMFEPKAIARRRDGGYPPCRSCQLTHPGTLTTPDVPRHHRMRPYIPNALRAEGPATICNRIAIGPPRTLITSWLVTSASAKARLPMAATAIFDEER